MTSQEEELWQRIQNFELDDPGIDFKFSARLARENGWTKAYAKRVVEEYKKFIFLCCISEHGVTPSDPVDQAWHLHLTFTRSYWTGLCKDTLNREIHHNPTKGGKKEADKFDGFYTMSHKLYADKFGVQPPADIWQDNHTRFNDINFQRVNTGKYWLLKKRRLATFALLGFILVLTSATLIQASEGITIPMLVIIIGIVIFAVYQSESGPPGGRNNGNNRNDGGGSGCSAGWNDGSSGHGAHHGHHGGDSGCGSGCSGCSASGCSGCGGGGD